MTNRMQIEVASREEWPAVLALTKTAYAEYAEKSDKVFWNRYEKSIETILVTDESVTRIVAKIQSKICGSILYGLPYEKQRGAAFVINRFPEMRLLAVPPEYRNRGIADKLISYCEDRAKLDGFDTITLHTTKLMETAKQMYERRGYVRYTEIDFVPDPGILVWGYRKDFMDAIPSPGKGD